MKKPTVIVLFCIALATECITTTIPKNWTICKYDEHLNTCLRDSIQNAFVDLVLGIPSLGVPVLDPLHFNKIVLNKGSGPVTIKLEFLNLDTLGIKDMHVDSVSSDWRTMVLDTTTPKITMKGNYKIIGKILALPINGDGACLLDMDNFKGRLKLYIDEKKDGDVAHYNITKIDFNFNVDHLNMSFDNLFNGDKELGETTNLFLNQNWKQILQELKPNVATAFSAAFMEIGNNLFAKIPKDEITPP